MDPNSSKKTIVDKYNIYFQNDAERYMRTYEAYEQFQAMTNQQAEGSSSGMKRTRTYIPCDREEAEQRLLEDYFGNDDTPPKYPEENFRRRYRMSSTFFAKIVNDITSYDAQPHVLADTLPEASFVVKRNNIHSKDTISLNGIYPHGLSFVKTVFYCHRDEKTLNFKRVQESVRKDIERAFGVLQGRWGIIRQPACALQINTLKRIMYCCIILHNMILQSEKFELSNFKDMFVNPEPNMQRTWIERCDLHVRRNKELRDSKVHKELRHDLVNHLWNRDH
ncbi:ALP1-like protein isoform X1 [Tanacetum coccineum]